MPNWLPATVVEHRPWTPGLFSLVLDRTVPFRAGQFLTLTRDPDGGRHAKRAYSVASAPDEALEFYIVEVEDGRVSPGLRELYPGDAVFVSDRGKGLFTLEDVRHDAEVLWMIGTGTGLAPYRSMLREGSVLDRFDEIVLVYGARRRDQLGYLAELQTLSELHPGLRIVPLVSRESADGLGLDGRVTDRLRDGTLERVADATMDPSSHVMLCGNPAMIREMQELLGERGMTRHTRRSPGHITTEKYW